MTNAVKDAVAEKIELLDRLDGKARRRSYKSWWIGSVALALVITTSAFLLVRRRFNSPEK
jgi:hypothetical protein